MIEEDNFLEKTHTVLGAKRTVYPRSNFRRDTRGSGELHRDTLRRNWKEQEAGRTTLERQAGRRKEVGPDLADRCPSTTQDRSVEEMG